ncbi:MAG: helix-turn-helix transcriptional regulator [Streptosporangiaceae bacterium]
MSSLDDPVRARLYQVVSASSAPLGRDEAAAAAGIGRPLAAYHLDKLVELGLLTATYQRRAGRAGPGAGRPAKLYARSGREFAVTVPPREYELAACLLAIAVESDASGQSRAALSDAARQYGASLAARGRPAAAARAGSLLDVQATLREHGFEPWQAADGVVRLRNCPFHQLAALHPDMVCGMNLALIDGLIEGFAASDLHPELDPQPGRCCVVIVDDSQPADPTKAETRTG